ncbi:hypothetical protein IPV09_06475 [Tessaracoccus sp. SD287]|uniref:hypothetical protein n=1 Tax=Tessaracoccus sp. SD287 TaxID=2782008 RepID=UPI001A95D5FC|nr:hypothetical protein [Tessaracoccus sp. SD287]MBO1030980.1 hypothetical protein [Tessaracoccus sp. SD287]
MHARDTDRGLEALADPELDAAFQAAAAQHRDAVVGSQRQRMLLVQARGIPLRVVSKFGERVARLQFADNTAILVNCDGPRRRIGSVGIALVKHRPVLVTAVHDDGSRLRVRLRWDDQHVDVEVLGGDQIP